MAEPVIIPVTLECVDVDTTNLNFGDAQKAISKNLSGIKKVIQDAFSGIDASAINKPIEKSMNAVTKQMQTAESAFWNYRKALEQAGKSTEEYKSEVSAANAAIKSQEQLVHELSQLGPAAGPHLAEAQKDLDALIEARNKINPLNFVDKASPLQLEKVVGSLKKCLSAQDDVVNANERFNQTVKDNRASDEYSELVKQAEIYRQKLKDLNEKSKEMEFKGATDTQWENLRKDVEWTESKMDDVLKQMDKAIKSGKAFRFGEGPKGDFRNQYNSLKMSKQNNAGLAAQRAQDNQSPFTAEYQKALDELDKLEKKVESIKAKSAKMVELGASEKQFQTLAYDAGQLDNKVEQAKANLANMVSTGSAFKFGKGDAAAEMTKINDKSDSLQKSLSDVANDADKATRRLSTMKTIGAVIDKIKTGFKAVGKAVGPAINKMASGFARVGKGILNAVKNLNIFRKSGHKTSDDLSKRFKKLTKNIMMFGLGFRTAYYFIKSLRNTFIEGFKQMGGQFSEVGEPLNRMIEAFTRLKGSLATAFQPLASVVIPILTQFINYMTGALEAVSRFTAALTGQGYIYKAVAKSAGSAADAAEEANQQLGSYDKLEVIQDNKGGGGAGSDADYTYEKEKLNAGGVAADFANMVKEAWAKADFTEVGKFVTDKLLGVLDVVETNFIPKVTGFVNRVLQSVNTFLAAVDFTAIGSKIGSIFNTLVDGLDWTQIGALLANLYNVVWQALDGLVNSIDWALLGQSLAEGITSLFDTLDFNSLVGAVSGLINGITLAIQTLLLETDWSDIAVTLGTAVNNLFNSIDYEQLGATIKLLVDTIWTFLGDFFATVDFEAIASNIASGINSLFNGDSTAFENALPTIANGFVTFFTTAIDEIEWETITNKLWEGLQTVLQSVGTAMQNSDNPLVSSFGEVILAISDALELLRPAIDAVIESVGPIIQAILPVISELLPPIADIISTVVTNLLPPIVRLIQTVLPLLTKIIQMILPHLEREMNKVSTVIAIIIDAINIVIGVVDAVVATVQVMGKAFNGEFDSIKDLFDELLAAWKPPINNIIGAFEGLVNSIIGGLNSMIRGINKFSIKIPDWDIFGKHAGKSWSLNIPEINKISIPRLAQGAVIPPNKEFLAMLGDQTHGTNIEAPLDTIKQALAEVMAEFGGAGNRQPIVLQVNGRTLAQVVWDEQEKRYKQTGKSMA